MRELDALGGEMGRAADKACIQYRLLNRGKGPAVWSLRAQADRRAYQQVMKHTLELQENLWVKQAEVVDLRVDETGAVSAVVTHTGAEYAVKAVVVGGPDHRGRRGPGLRAGRPGSGTAPHPAAGGAGIVHPPL